MRKLLGLLSMLMASTAMGQTVYSIVEQNCIDGICRVKADMGGGRGATGTGCLIAPTWVLTADHVTEGYPAKVQFRNEEIQVVGRWQDKFADCAVLKLAHQPRTGKVLTVARQEGSGIVCCVGFDNGNTSRLRMFEGTVEPRAGNWTELRIRPHNARMAEHGNSGGPVFNARGEVLSSLHSNSDMGYTYANSNTQLHQFIERIRQRTGEKIINWASMSPAQGFGMSPFGSASPPQWGTPPASGQMPSQPFIMPIQNQPSTLNPPSQAIPIRPLPPLNPPAVVPPSQPVFPTQQTPRPMFIGITYFYPYQGQ
jgi:hypothetical protein